MRLLEAKRLTKKFHKNGVRAVVDASFCVEEAKTLGIIGASGSGKSTLLRLALCLLRADAGEVFFEGARIDRLPEKKRADFRRKAQIIFQDPYQSLDPRMKVADILKEPFLISGQRQASGLADKIGALMASVGLPLNFLPRYPHELSGGECQRVAIARSLSLGPRVLLCDEAVSALDAVTKIQILNLLLRLQKDRGLALVFVSHDERAVRHMSDRVLRMSEGVVFDA